MFGASKFLWGNVFLKNLKMFYLDLMRSVLRFVLRSVLRFCTKLLWRNVFSKNYAKSRVFQKHNQQQAFLELFFSNFDKLLIFLETSVKRDFFCKIDPPSLLQIFELFSLMGWMDGWNGTAYQKCASNFFILCEYIGNLSTYIYIYISMFKVCHQLCYGFENLMSSWRVWI